jgi:ABC-2 type transport system permease protein
MTRLIAGELIKVRTTRTALGFGLAGVLLTLAGVLISVLAGDPGTLEDKRAALSFGGTVAVVLLVYGVVGATGEFRHRTLAPAVLIAPDRVRLVVARMAAYAVTAGIVGVAMGFASFAIGIPLLDDAAGPHLEFGDYSSLVGGGLLTVVLSGALGVAVGTLVRNQVAAVVGVFVWILVLEPLVGLIDDDWVKYTIGISSGSLAQGGSDDASMATAALVLASWTAVFAIAGVLVDRRRDVD